MWKFANDEHGHKLRKLYINHKARYKATKNKYYYKILLNIVAMYCVPEYYRHSIFHKMSVKEFRAWQKKYSWPQP